VPELGWRWPPDVFESFNGPRRGARCVRTLAPKPPSFACAGPAILYRVPGPRSGPLSPRTVACYRGRLAAVSGLRQPPAQQDTDHDAAGRHPTRSDFWPSLTIWSRIGRTRFAAAILRLTAPARIPEVCPAARDVASLHDVERATGGADEALRAADAELPQRRAEIVAVARPAGRELVLAARSPCLLTMLYNTGARRLRDHRSTDR